MSGKCGFDVNCVIKSLSGMRFGITPGKCVLKNCGSKEEGLLARVSK